MATTESMTHDERLSWLSEWCTANGLGLDLAGECGFGRECVGVGTGGEWVDYDTHDLETYTPLPGQAALRAGPEAPDAYHKHDCLAVLGRGEAAETQLYLWVRRLVDAGAVIEHHVPKVMPDLGSLLGHNARTRIVLPVPDGELPRVYCWCNQGAGTDFQVWIAMADDGEVVTSHVCSHESFARTDLHDRKLDLYDAKFGGHGDGVRYRLVWEVAPADVYAKNQALRDEHNKTLAAAEAES